MHYIIHNLGVAGERHAEWLRDQGFEVADVRADDQSVPDRKLAGKIWTSAQVAMKLCDMFADNCIKDGDTFVVANSWDVNFGILQSLLHEYNIDARIIFNTGE